MSRLCLQALILALIAIAVGSCGRSAKTSSETSPSAQTESSTATSPSAQTGKLTRTQLIAAADLICKRVNARNDTTTFKGQNGYARILPEVAAYYGEAVAAMRKITPSASMANGWKELISNAQKYTEGLAELGQLAQANKLGEEKDVVSNSANKDQARMFAIARREGFADCARNK